MLSHTVTWSRETGHRKARTGEWRDGQRPGVEHIMRITDPKLGGNFTVVGPSEKAG
jgi:hypothetical protein